MAEEVYVSADEKWAAVVDKLRSLHAEGRPVLIGTNSVAASEHLSEMLNAAGLYHQVLNARQDQEEAEVVARAGETGRITVATNMAGRGTDIRLAPGVADMGGLHVLSTVRHDSRRIDRQLFGRCGRQGDPGSYQVVVSLEDEIFQGFFKPYVARLRKLFPHSGKPLPQWLGDRLVSYAQGTAERHHGRIRRDLLRSDDQLNDLLAFTGRGE
jgi:preprotein translocase subunit SecA